MGAAYVVCVRVRPTFMVHPFFFWLLLMMMFDELCRSLAKFSTENNSNNNKECQQWLARGQQKQIKLFTTTPMKRKLPNQQSLQSANCNTYKYLHTHTYTHVPIHKFAAIYANTVCGTKVNRVQAAHATATSCDRVSASRRGVSKQTALPGTCLRHLFRLPWSYVRAKWLLPMSWARTAWRFPLQQWQAALQQQACWKLKTVNCNRSKWVK